MLDSNTSAHYWRSLWRMSASLCSKASGKGARRLYRRLQLVVQLVACCCVSLAGYAEQRDAPAAAPTPVASQPAQSAGRQNTGTHLPGASTNTNSATPPHQNRSGVTQSRLPFQKGEPTDTVLRGYWGGDDIDVVLNAGLPETPAEWEACEKARANLSADRWDYPAVRLGRKVAVQEQGEEMALRLYPGLVKEHGLLTGAGIRHPKPCWVGAWEKLDYDVYYDHVTDLTWYLETDSNLDWDEAQQHIAALNGKNEHSGWRMATSTELLTLAAAYEQWVSTRPSQAKSGDVFWSADEPVGVGVKPGFHTVVSLENATIEYASEHVDVAPEDRPFNDGKREAKRKASALAVRRGRLILKTGATQSPLSFQKGQPGDALLAGFTVGKVPMPTEALNAGLPETLTEWDACLTARKSLELDMIYPAVRLGRKAAVQHQGEEMALRLFPGLVKEHGLLTGDGWLREKPCWVGAWEKLSDEAYYDHVTDLTWYLETSRNLDWDGALQYVAELNAASGDSGWRMATSAEQLTLAAAYEHWVFTRVRFGAVTPIVTDYWSADDPIGDGVKPGFHTTVWPAKGSIDYLDRKTGLMSKAGVLAVRSGRWQPPPHPAPPAGRIVPGHRHPDSQYPIPGRVLPAGIVRTPEAVHHCAAASQMYYKHGVFPPVRVSERIQLRSEPLRTTIASLRSELRPFDFGVYMDLPPSCFLLAIEKRSPDHFVEWVTGLEWQFHSPDDRRITFNELNQALADLNRQVTDKAEEWRLPTFIELALFGTADVALLDFESKKPRRVPVWLADSDSTKPPAKGRLCTEMDSGGIENAEEEFQGRCAMLLVRAVPPQPGQP